MLGTVGYMSPEQMRGQPADARSDIFAFGAVLYELLSGHRAFRGNSAADVMSAILKDEPAPLVETGRNVPPPLERLVSHCLEKSAEERFQSARDIAYDLEAAVRDLRLDRRRAARASRARAAQAARRGGDRRRRARRRRRPRRRTRHETGPLGAARLSTQLTFRRGSIGSARFAPDGQSVVYSAKWDGAPAQLFLKRPDDGRFARRSAFLPPSCWRFRDRAR